MKKIESSLGFTLVEILISIAIIIAASTIIVGVVTSTFRSSNKTTSSELVRQNGTNAISQLTRLIQFADSFEGASQDNVTYDTTCPVQATEYSYIKIRSNDVEKVLSCPEVAVAIPPAAGVSLLDESKVSPEDCTFTCSQASEVVSPIIGIYFSLSLNSLDRSTVEKNSSATFSTSVKMRNL